MGEFFFDLTKVLSKICPSCFSRFLLKLSTPTLRLSRPTL